MAKVPFGLRPAYMAAFIHTVTWLSLSCGLVAKIQEGWVLSNMSLSKGLWFIIILVWITLYYGDLYLSPLASFRPAYPLMLDYCMSSTLVFSLYDQIKTKRLKADGEKRRNITPSQGWGHDGQWMMTFFPEVFLFTLSVSVLS